MNGPNCSEIPLQSIELDRVGVNRCASCLGERLDFKELGRRIAVPGHPRIPRRRASILDAIFPWLDITQPLRKVNP